MYLSYHGGGCCGVKHIWNFPADPKTPISALNECRIGEQPYKRFFSKAAPSETAIARLDRYIKYMHEVAPGNLIEIFLAEYKNNRPMCQISHGWNVDSLRANRSSTATRTTSSPPIRWCW